MSPWYRVFGGTSEMPAPASILAFLDGQNPPVAGDFAADASGWYRAELRVNDMVLQLERYLADEEGIRAELNSWAAWLETRENAPEHVHLMECMIQTKQLFTLQSPEGSSVAERLCAGLSQFLADRTGGVYQIDGRGFFAADGTLLVGE